MANEIDFEKLPDETFEKLGTTREKFFENRRLMEARDAKTPPAGVLAPDFETLRLSADGKRTGETLRLSSTRGRPVALVFGSYT
jgi:hypothetical protein